MTEAKTECAVITGMSGAGKMSVLNVLEDMGYYAMNNVPAEILPQLTSLLCAKIPSQNKIAVIVNLREEKNFGVFFDTIKKMKAEGVRIKTLFVDASDETLVRRYEATRRRHPLADGVTLLQAIQSERTVLRIVKEKTDAEIDTTETNLVELRHIVTDKLTLADDKISVVVSSFGFKYGVPADANYIFDVRFLPNPNYVPELHALSGKDIPVKNYMESFPSLNEFFDKAISLIEYLTSVYSQTGKKQMHLAFGCTGGRHRSVLLAEMTAARLSAAGCCVSIIHRDIDRGTLD